MGVKLRSLYNGYLETQYFPDQVYVSSTAVERVVQSGQLFMAGLYPAAGNQVWDADFMWNPIPVNQDSLDKTVVSRTFLVNHDINKRFYTPGRAQSKLWTSSKSIWCSLFLGCKKLSASWSMVCVV